MDTRIPSVRPDTVSVESATRPTPTPVRVQFSAVLAGSARGLVQGAEVAMRAMPGAPLMAVSVRGGIAGSGTSGAPFSAGGRVSSAPEGPGMSGVVGASGGGVGVGVGGVGVGVGTGGVGGGGTGDGGVESSLAQSQEMNLYYLRIQEEVNAQNRTFSTLSNVLKAEHDTVKTAIGNIR